MIEKVVSIFSLALVATMVGIALRPNAPTASVLTAGTTGFAKIETAAFGPS